MNKTEKIKTDTLKNFENLKQYLIETNSSFDLVITNYTAEIKGSFNIKSFKNNIEVRAFMGFQKIKKDLIDYSANELPEKKDFNLYFDINDGEILKLNKLTGIHNIDLTAAYLTVLLNSGFISLDTFKYCMTLEKKQRLQCVGMLASKKTIFKYENGELVNAFQEKKDTEGVFYYCVDYVAQIMSELKVILKNDFIFSWVDSVYYTGEYNTPLICEYLDKKNLKYKYKFLENIKASETNNFYFVQHGNTEGKNCFYLPKKQNEFKTDLLKFLKLI